MIDKILMIAAHREEFASRGTKNQTSLIFNFPHGPREANFSPKIRRTLEQTAELTALRGILLSFFLQVCGGLMNSIEEIERSRLRSITQNVLVEFNRVIRLD